MMFIFRCSTTMDWGIGWRVGPVMDVSVVVACYLQYKEPVLASTEENKKNCQNGNNATEQQ